MRKFIAIFLLFCPLFLLGQNTRQIKGQIIDRTDGSPIVGATVFIDQNETAAKNYNPQGTVAGVDGRFVFTLPVSVKYVTISSLGYEVMKVDISSTKDLVIRLAPQATMVDEVVVTGYQKIEKRKLTSSIAKIDMEAINRVGVASVDQMLEGQLAGVFTSPTTGAPGAPAKTRVRSAVTLSGTDDPLWVLDGMPLEGNEIPRDWSDKENIDNLRTMSIAGMNPDDIADITVLKDAAATAIYGARAANGVIIITSKKGNRDQPIRVNASLATFITEKPNFDKLNLMNASEKVDFELGLASNGALNFQQGMGAVARILDMNGGADRTNLIAGNPLSAAGAAAIAKLRNQGANWADEIYRLTVNQQYSLSVSGGGKKASYYFSTGYYNEQGTTKGTGFDRFNLTLKTDYDILKNLRFGVSMFGTSTNNKSYITDANGFSNPSNYSRRVNPYLDIYNPDGSYVYDPDMVAYQKNDDTTLPFNFMEESHNTKYQLKSKSFKSLFDLEYKPIKSLRLYTQLGIQVDNSESERYADKETYNVRKFQKDKDLGVKEIPDGGIIKNANGNAFQYNWKAQAEYSTRVARVHEIDLMAGLEMRANTNKNISTQAFGFDPKTLTSKPIIFDDTQYGREEAMKSKYKQYTNSFNENRFVSYYATASYTYDNRYTFFGSMRYDGTNLFGVDPKFKFTPLWSASGSWNINREEWLRDVTWISNLKLRASYGVQGNIDRNTSPYVTGVWGNTNIGGQYEPTINANLPNRYLRWETTKTWNAAVDFAVLDNKLSMTFEAYRRVSDNLITSEFLAQENGFQYTSSNFGKMTGEGLELSINSVNIANKSFRWTTSFNIATNRTKVNKINFEQDNFSPSRQGYSSNAIFGFKTAGLDENGLPLFVDKSGSVVSMREYFGAKAEEVPYEGYYLVVNGDAEFIRNQQVYLGDGAPKFTGGLINRFNYKSFDLTISGNFVLGQMVTATPFFNPTATNPGLNLSRDAFNIWSPNNTSGRYPAILPQWNKPYYDNMPTDAQYVAAILDGTSTDIFRKLDMWTKTMNYFRINSIRLGYTLPSAFTNKLHIASARLSVEARNPFVISTNYKGYFDPENYGNVYAQPLARTISVGLNISF